MNRRTICFLPLTVLAVLGWSLVAPDVQAVTIDMMLVGNPGNANDTHGTGYGGVAYVYRIGTTEVTNAQYVEFLNAVAKTDANGLYNTIMGSDSRGGITRTGSSDSYTYAVKSPALSGAYTYGDKPVVYVSWYDTLRFANWLHNGQPNTGTQTAATTEDGAYTFTGATTVGARNTGATWFLPNENEWYKAAYYDPELNGGTGGYYDYPTSTNSVPTNNLPTSDTGDSANFNYTTGNSSYPLTDTGAYAISESPYRTYDQGGNVSEWNETLVVESARGLRGGSWSNSSSFLDASNRGSNGPTLEDLNIGFRVASIPEPSGIYLAALSVMGLWMWRRRRS